MFARLFAHLSARLQMRQSTACLLSRADDRLLLDIGLTRADIEAMHLGITPQPAEPALRSGQAVPGLLRA
ncbi:MAG: DUF1127 domain-containing protein [Paracoccaceae bacterium]